MNIFKSQATATIVIITYYLAYKNPKDFTVAHACAVLMLALMATGTGEQAREMLRKPYVIGRHMYSNGTRVSEVADQDVPPTSHPLPLTNVMRADEVRPSLTPEQALSGAPAQEQQRFKVPQILGED